MRSHARPDSSFCFCRSVFFSRGRRARRCLVRLVRRYDREGGGFPGGETKERWPSRRCSSRCLRARREATRRWSAASSRSMVCDMTISSITFTARYVFAARVLFARKDSSPRGGDDTEEVGLRRKLSRGHAVTEVEVFWPAGWRDHPSSQPPPPLPASVGRKGNDCFGRSLTRCAPVVALFSLVLLVAVCLLSLTI